MEIKYIGPFSWGSVAVAVAIRVRIFDGAIQIIYFMRRIVETQTLLFLHQDVDNLNEIALKMFPGDVLSFNSADYITTQDSPDEILNFPIAYLNSADAK